MIDLLFNQSGQVIDFFLVTNGAWQSEQVASLANDGVHLTDREMLGMARFLSAAQNDCARAMTLYSNLSLEVRHNAAIFDMACLCAEVSGQDARLLPMLEEHRSVAPEDTTTANCRYSAHFTRREWEPALTALAELRALFPDTYWDAVDANLRLENGSPRQAMALATQLSESDPSLLEARAPTFRAAVAMRDEEQARQSLLELRNRGVDLQELADRPGFEAARRFDLADSG